ncbi:hypothetical protein E1B28_003303 [Marasmius oreades]|uniref:HNH nuclease domain-containing protein n=1 Tax=Marasmius oreades TaxID=181124 RepID=A0A9P7RLY6_9AGAR|nr:uncharacterized protein E1B28_003303 [Marasmius oreades]KAG7085762.1 hypothetical protein E1B28_003303 [Marasmius oreades]
MYHKNIPLPASFDLDKKEVKRAGVVWTECAHIVPESTYFEISDEEPLSSVVKKSDYSASLLAVLKRFGYNVENINGSQVHSLCSIMTMEQNVRDSFDRLELWFEATEIENCYRIRTVIDMMHIPDKVTFTHPAIFGSGSHANSPLPSPELPALHGSCAKVSHLSGAATYLDELDQNLDDLPILGGRWRVI